MCGVVGLFVGCPFATQYLGLDEVEIPTLAIPPSEFEYKSKLQDWDRKASVRNKPRRTLLPEDVQRAFFPQELVPVSQHPRILELGETVIREVQVQHLYRYLDFTTKLEAVVVNSVTRDIAQGSIGFQVPEEMRFDAWKIYCDEAYHAYFSEDLKRQIQQASGIVPKEVSEPMFLERLHVIQEALPSRRLQQLAELFFVIVSETLISGTLAQIPTRSDIAQAVKDVVGDHAEDEGKHHAYFASLLDLIWCRLTTDEQNEIGKLVPEFIVAFLSPDLRSLREELSTYGLTKGRIDQILEETYPDDMLAASMKYAARSALKHFERNGIFHNTAAKDVFLEYGLIEE